jgi:hypothetical protein
MRNRPTIIAIGLLAFSLTLAAFATPAFARAKSYLPKSVSAGVLTRRASASLTYLRGGHKVGVSKQYVKLYRWTKVRGRGRWVYRSRARTDSSGVFAVTLPAGYSYRLYYAGDRAKRAVWSRTLSIAVVPETTVLEADQDSWLEGDAVSGNLTDGFGEYAPIAGATLTVKSGETEVGTTVTDADGVWTYFGLPVGDYRVVFSGDETRASSACALTVDYPEAQTAIVDVPDTSAIDEGGTTALVSGRLVTDLASGDEDVTGWQPLAGAAVVVRRTSDGAPVVQLTTDAEGGWSTALPVGSYAVSYAGMRGASVDSAHYTMLASEFEFGVVALPPADPVIDVATDFTIDPGETTALVSGTLTLSRDAGDPIPIAGFTVRILSYDEVADSYRSYGTTTTDSGGNWEMRLPEGVYDAETSGSSDYLAGDGVHYYLSDGASDLVTVWPSE